MALGDAGDDPADDLVEAPGVGRGPDQEAVEQLVCVREQEQSVGLGTVRVPAAARRGGPRRGPGARLRAITIAGSPVAKPTAR